MAHIWQKREGGTWEAETLPGAAEAAWGHGAAGRPGLRILRARSSATDQLEWVSLTPPGFSVNGETPATGARVLADRDEIMTPGRARMYFSTESKPEVRPLPDGLGEIFCARCKQPINAGSPAVACPQCGNWHHQSEDLGCWLYPGVDTCALCPHPTALDADFQFNPETL